MLPGLQVEVERRGDRVVVPHVGDDRGLGGIRAARSAAQHPPPSVVGGADRDPVEEDVPAVHGALDALGGLEVVRRREDVPDDDDAAARLTALLVADRLAGRERVEPHDHCAGRAAAVEPELERGGGDVVPVPAEPVVLEEPRPAQLGVGERDRIRLARAEDVAAEGDVGAAPDPDALPVRGIVDLELVEDIVLDQDVRRLVGDPVLPAARVGGELIATIVAAGGDRATGAPVRVADRDVRRRLADAADPERPSVESVDHDVGRVAVDAHAPGDLESRDHDVVGARRRAVAARIPDVEMLQRDARSCGRAERDRLRGSARRAGCGLPDVLLGVRALLHVDDVPALRERVRAIERLARPRAVRTRACGVVARGRDRDRLSVWIHPSSALQDHGDLVGRRTLPVLAEPHGRPRWIGRARDHVAVRREQVSVAGVRIPAERDRLRGLRHHAKRELSARGASGEGAFRAFRNDRDLVGGSALPDLRSRSRAVVGARDLGSVPREHVAIAALRLPAERDRGRGLRNDAQLEGRGRRAGARERDEGCRRDPGGEDDGARPNHRFAWPPERRRRRIARSGVRRFTTSTVLTLACLSTASRRANATCPAPPSVPTQPSAPVAGTCRQPS